MNKIVIAPDSFKGTMSAIEVCEIIEKGILAEYPDADIVKVPIADGGEGTVDAFLYAIGGEKKFITVHNPLMEQTNACYGILNDGKTAVIELAQASGLPLVEDNKQALEASTYGTGELIKNALDQGCNKIILGIGGSATNDGGVGAFAALGVKFLNKQGNDIAPNGKGIKDLVAIDASGLDKRLAETEMLVACDVDNVLCGKNGASAVFGPQKGASKKDIIILDKNLKHFASVLKRNFGEDYSKVKGTGAAGGIGISLLNFTNAKLMSGIEIVMEAIDFIEISKDVDLVITGEGKIDGQSLMGKAPIGVAKCAKKNNVPVIAIVGAIGENVDKIINAGIDAIFSTTREAVPFEIAKKTCRQDLRYLVQSLMIYKNL